MNGMETDYGYETLTLGPSGGRQPSVVFLYLGRRGALCRFTLELARAALDYEAIRCVYFVSRANELIGHFRGHPLGLHECDTFESSSLFAFGGNFVRTRRHLLDYVRRERPLAVVTLMPHLWTPLLAPSIRRLGVLYATIIHDGVPHPGDPTGRLNRWLLRDANHADLIVTLSQAVSQLLFGSNRIEKDRILRLFHPDLTFDSGSVARKCPRRPFRLLFFGRIMPYKGLSLLVDATEMLRNAGVQIDLGVIGSGDIGPVRARLSALGAEVINRWVADHEIGPILARYDAMACSHVEASQSGAAAAAFGNCMPVVGMPVGGVAEQIIEGKTGVLAKRVSARAFADALNRLIVQPGLYERISYHLSNTARDRSMHRFLGELMSGLSEAACGNHSWPGERQWGLPELVEA